ncbi:heterogeneous nuclear ribonucleoprotein M-like [Pogoniulus pusillus]|uniref:heterogeneous nuclear ribonucleoprotein M-like n=1 Tax=Pogoniulus pusillus TaxID=488313 RepID=UPI0030B95D2F
MATTAAAVAAAAENAGLKMDEPAAAPVAAAAVVVVPPPPNGAGVPGDQPPKSDGERPSQNEKRKEKSVKRGGNRFEPYANPAKRYRAFITNIPFDVKWQSLKDLVKEKVGEVTYVELLMDAEGKSRVSVLRDISSVDFLHDKCNLWPVAWNQSKPGEAGDVSLLRGSNPGVLRAAVGGGEEVGSGLCKQPF